jgi:acetyl-CoA carboxylase biotin carboxyl carrier protein
MKIDREAIRDLAEILNDTNLTEIEVEEKDLKIRVAREVYQTTVTAPAAIAAPLAAAPVAVAAVEAAPVAIDASHPGALTSPMVGTAYMSPEPGAANFVSVGSNVNAGDTIMIVEAMKVMNPIKAEKSGTVSQILASDSSPVEFGDVLAIIE